MTNLGHKKYVRNKSPSSDHPPGYSFPYPNVARTTKQHYPFSSSSFRSRTFNNHHRTNANTSLKRKSWVRPKSESDVAAASSRSTKEEEAEEEEEVLVEKENESEIHKDDTESNSSCVDILNESANNLLTENDINAIGNISKSGHRIWRRQSSSLSLTEQTSSHADSSDSKEAKSSNVKPTPSSSLTQTNMSKLGNHKLVLHPTPPSSHSSTFSSSSPYKAHKRHIQQNARGDIKRIHLSSKDIIKTPSFEEEYKINDVTSPNETSKKPSLSNDRNDSSSTSTSEQNAKQQPLSISATTTATSFPTLTQFAYRTVSSKIKTPHYPSKSMSLNLTKSTDSNKNSSDSKSNNPIYTTNTKSNNPIPPSLPRNTKLIRVHQTKYTPLCPYGSKCTLTTCTKRHDIPLWATKPTCIYFEKHNGMCFKKDCAYRHVKIAKDTPQCQNFIQLGYCLKEGCDLRHDIPERKKNNKAEDSSNEDVARKRMNRFSYVKPKDG